MPGDARLAALGGPTPVAIHDDRYVPRQAIPVDCGEQFLIARTGLDDAVKIFQHLWPSKSARILIVAHG
jgi:hypothetical protein